MKINTTYFKLKERYIYGSSRVGVRNSDLDVLPLPDKDFSMTTVHYSIGSRMYELSNHLGNVLSVISDKVIPVFSSSTVISEMRADIRVAQDYSPFGVTLDGRDFVVSERYRFGFQGQEKDDEVSGAGNSYTAEYWQYDSRLGRRWNIDPVVKHHESPYATFANNPIAFIDPNGKDTINVINKTGEMNRISGDGKDVFRIIDEAGKTLNTLEFDKGTIQYTWEYKNDSEDTDLPINVIQLKGNANTQKAFEILATNTEVEWSFTATKRGSSQNGFLTTSHEKSREGGAIKLLNEKNTN